MISDVGAIMRGTAEARRSACLRSHGKTRQALTRLCGAPAAAGSRRGAPMRSYGKTGKTIDIDPEVRPSSQGQTPVVEFDADELSEKARAALNDAQRNWERLDEKPAAVALTVSILVGLWVRTFCSLGTSFSASSRACAFIF